MPIDDTITFAQTLLKEPSLTPHDGQCQDLIRARLEPLGFVCQDLSSGSVTNSYLKLDRGGKMLWLAGHTDVVPTGPDAEWLHPPFAANIDGDWLYGRGACDMKGSLAAMVIAVEQWLQENPDSTGSIAFVITSDEEGPAEHGTKSMVEQLKQQHEIPDWCLVGEPSSQDKLGDTIKVGRRGSLSAEIIIHGKQGHIAYPQLAVNPIHHALLALEQLCKIEWDQGNEHFPPTSFQISNIQAGTGAYNVIPGSLTLNANFRFSPEITAEQLKVQTEAILKKHQLNFTIDWHLSGEPFLTSRGTLVNAIEQAIQDQLGIQTTLSTSGGTSDGRFIAPLGCQVVEFGPLNATIHQINERVALDDLSQLTQTLKSLFSLLFIEK